MPLRCYISPNAHNSGVLRTAIGLLILLMGTARAEPYLPTDDGEILERVPAATETRELEPLRQRLLASPSDLTAAVQLATGYLQIGRETADPRFTSYAQATITPWLKSPTPPAAMLVLSATALQSTHQFDASLAALDQALQADPTNAQAWLTKATVLQVQGKFAEAREACGNLLRSADQLVAVSCIANVNGLNGKLQQSYQSLERLIPMTAQSPDLRSWIEGQLGEMATRLGDLAAAERHFLTALKAAPGDVYLKAAYADLLLTQNRHAEVISLLDTNEQQDVLLLRLAIAGKRSQHPSAPRWIDTFDARYQAAQRAGDTSHLREYARFLLEVRDDAKAALDVARKNWQVQREPADILVYLNAASASKSPDAAAEVWAWIRETGYEDRAVAALQAGAKP
jgi:tetratricopeptide (TPR) repeat protein